MNTVERLFLTILFGVGASGIWAIIFDEWVEPSIRTIVAKRLGLQIKRHVLRGRGYNYRWLPLGLFPFRTEIRLVAYEILALIILRWLPIWIVLLAFILFWLWTN